MVMPMCHAPFSAALPCTRAGCRSDHTFCCMLVLQRCSTALIRAALGGLRSAAARAASLRIRSAAHFCARGAPLLVITPVFEPAD